LRRPGIDFEIRRGDFFARPPQKIDKSRDIQRVMFWREWLEIFFRELEEPDRRTQTSPMLRVRWLLEIFLQMNECARGLDQSFEKINVSGLSIEPNLFQNIVRFVVTLVVPASKISAIERMGRDLARKVGVVPFELAHELRNSFAFVHEAFNFSMPPMMGKPTFLEGTANSRCHNKE
jgi:hypothetical protein